MTNQEKVWDSIAKKWSEYREIPSPTVIDFLKNKKGKILDLGCGSGRNFSAIERQAELYASDFSKEMLRLAKNKAEKLKLKSEFFHNSSDNLPLEDDFFDSSICIALLHSIEKKQKRVSTIKELYRTLKPGSQILISVWGRNSPRLKNKPKKCFIPWSIQTREEGKHKEERFTYIYDKEELEQEVKSAGFKILQSWEERNINIVAEK